MNTTILVKCARCKNHAILTSREGDVYALAEMEGWSWKEEAGWSCPPCSFATVGQKRPTTPSISQQPLIPRQMDNTRSILGKTQVKKR